MSGTGGSAGASGRRRLTNKLYSAEEQALDQIAREAEARLAARRQARAEAREIRMRELEKQQKENDEHSDRHYELLSDPLRALKSNGREISSSPQRILGGSNAYAGSPSFPASSRRSSSDDSAVVTATSTNNVGSNHVLHHGGPSSLSSDKEGSVEISHRELRYQLTDLEEKFRRAMVSNAQLDNEKSALVHSVDTLKEDLEELDEQLLLSQREFREKNRAYDQCKRDLKKITEERDLLSELLKQRDELIEEHGLCIIGVELTNGDKDESENAKDETREVRKSRSQRRDSDEDEEIPKKPPSLSKAALVSIEAANLLQQAGEGSLDGRLKKFAEEKQDLLDEIYRLRLDIEEERQKSSKLVEQLTGNGLNLDSESLSSTIAPGTIPLSLLNSTSGPEFAQEIQREASKQASDYKFKLKKSEQEVATLQASVARLEGQVARYKTAAEEGEKLEDELKAEKRKLLREYREAQARIEELETSNAHLQKRIDKLKSARNALLKT